MRGSRNYVGGGGGGGGGSRSIWQKSSDNLFLVLSLFYSRKWLISKKTIIFQSSRGGPTFSRGGGGPTFSGSGGSNCLFI